MGSFTYVYWDSINDYVGGIISGLLAGLFSGRDDNSPGPGPGPHPGPGPEITLQDNRTVPTITITDTVTQESKVVPRMGVSEEAINRVRAKNAGIHISINPDGTGIITAPRRNLIPTPEIHPDLIDLSIPATPVSNNTIPSPAGSSPEAPSGSAINDQLSGNPFRDIPKKPSLSSSSIRFNPIVNNPTEPNPWRKAAEVFFEKSPEASPSSTENIEMKDAESKFLERAGSTGSGTAPASAKVASELGINTKTKMNPEFKLNLPEASSSTDSISSTDSTETVKPNKGKNKELQNKFLKIIERKD